MANRRLPDQGEEIAFKLFGISRLMQTGGPLFCDGVVLIQLSQQQAAGIRSYPTTLKIGAMTSLEKRLSMQICLRQIVFKGYAA